MNPREKLEELLEPCFGIVPGSELDIARSNLEHMLREYPTPGPKEAVLQVALGSRSIACQLLAEEMLQIISQGNPPASFFDLSAVQESLGKLILRTIPDPDLSAETLSRFISPLVLRAAELDNDNPVGKRVFVQMLRRLDKTHNLLLMVFP